MDKIYEWSESWQGRQRAYLIETETYNEYEIGYYEWNNKLYFAVRNDGRVTAYHENIEQIKEIVNENWKD